MALLRRRRVAVTTEESAPGVPFWGPNQIITELKDGETEVSFENLLAGRHYYVRVWYEDAFGNVSPDLETSFDTPPDSVAPSIPTGLTLTAGTNGFTATWSAVADADLAEYEIAYNDDNGSGNGPYLPLKTRRTRTTQMWIDQLPSQKTWVQVRAVDYSGNFSRYTQPVSITPTKTVPVAFSANGYLDSSSPMRAYVKVPPGSTVTSALVTLAFRQFMAPATDAASGGGSTSGASSASTTTNTTGLTFNADNLSTHDHGVGTPVKAYATVLIGVNGSGNHTHDIPHTHSTPNHTHALTYGTIEESYPASHSVKVKTYKRIGGTWTLQNTSASLVNDLEDLDLTSVITSAGDWRLEVLSDTAQPNGGRLGLDLFGTITVVI